jgi:hypothetical protein
MYLRCSFNNHFPLREIGLMSAFKKTWVADSLFLFQIVGAVVFCGAYALRATVDVTGSSIVQFGLVGAFLFFCLTLSVGAYKTKPDRATKQGIATYIVWLVLLFVVIGSTLSNKEYQWNDKETAMLVMGIVLTGAVLLIGVTSHTRVTDPMMRGLFAIAFKAVPQVLLAWKFLEEGASGTPAAAIIVGHVTILIRLGQIYFMVRASGWDRNRKWLTLSEVSNEVSWIIATLVWLMV